MPLIVVQCVGLLLIACAFLDSGVDEQPCMGDTPHPPPVAHARYLAPLYSPHVTGISPYRDAYGAIHAVVAMTWEQPGGDLWDLDTDPHGDGTLTAIAATPALRCLGAPTVTLDGAHLACVQAKKGFDHSCCKGSTLLLMQRVAADEARLVRRLTPAPTLGATDGEEATTPLFEGGQQLSSSAPGEVTDYLNPTWSPDGQHLAVLEQERAVVGALNQAPAQPPCALSLYALAPSGTLLIQTARLAFPDPSICAARRLTWSPDGAMLAALLPDVIDLVDASAFPRAALGPGVPGARPLSLTLQPDDIRPLAQVYDAFWLDWMPNAQAVTVLDTHGLADIAVATGVRTSRSTGISPRTHPVLPGFAWLPGAGGLVLPIGWTNLVAPIAMPTLTPSPPPSATSGAAGSVQPRRLVATALAPLAPANCIQWQAGLYLQNAI